MIDVNDFLTHHGIKGMRWGVSRSDKQLARSGGSTESGSSTKGVVKAAKAATSVKMVNPDELKKREAKAQKFDNEVVRLRKENKENKVKLNAARPLMKNKYRNMIVENEKLIKTAEKDAIAARDGRMSSRQKKLLIGGAVAAGLLLAYSANNMRQSGEFNRMAIKGKMFMNKDAERFKRNDKLADKNFSADDIMKNVVPGINPDYGAWGTNMNCRRATFAYEMRRRGLDVQATKTSNASGQNMVGLMNAMSPGEKERSTGVIGMVKLLKQDPDGAKKFQAFPAGGKNKINAYSAKGIFEALEKEPNGSRGEFGAMWASAVPGIPGGGHSMAYEIIKGKAHIFDGQTGKEYKVDNDIFDRMESTGYTRLDNVKLNEDFLSKWVR